MSRPEVERLLDSRVLLRLDRHFVVGGCLAERATEDAEFDHRLKLDALLARFPDAVASFESSARMHNLPVFSRPPFPVATREKGAWRGGLGRIRRDPLPPSHVMLLDGVRVTTIPRTVVDIARSTSLRAAAVVGDAALRRGIPRAQLLETVRECAWRQDGLRRAEAAIEFCDARAESALESLSRVIMKEYDVPPPELQYKIRLGGVEYRADFYWRQRRLVGEADGREKYSRNNDEEPEAVVWREKLREDALRDAGYRFVRWTYAQLLGDTDYTISRIMRRLEP